MASAANRSPNTTPINEAATTPTDTEVILLSSALVFFLIVADNTLLFIRSRVTSASNFSSVVKLANSGLEKFLYRFAKSLHEQEQFTACESFVVDELWSVVVEGLAELEETVKVEVTVVKCVVIIVGLVVVGAVDVTEAEDVDVAAVDAIDVVVIASVDVAVLEAVDVVVVEVVLVKDGVVGITLEQPSSGVASLFADTVVSSVESTVPEIPMWSQLIFFFCKYLFC